MSEKITRIFIDSNVWFSAFYGSATCQKIIKVHQEGKIIAIISNRVLNEIVRNVKKKIPNRFEELKKFLLIYPPEIVSDPVDFPKKIISLVSTGNLPIFVSAINAKVNYFITGNIRDFEVKNLEKKTGIKILFPKQAAELLDL